MKYVFILYFISVNLIIFFIRFSLFVIRWIVFSILNIGFVIVDGGIFFLILKEKKKKYIEKVY